MTDAVPLLLAWAAGVGLGVVYFGGLWWTVRRAGSFRRPASSMLISGLVRMGLALGGFYLVGGGSWQRMLLCLFGFVVGRAAVTWWLRPVQRARASEALHAP